MRVFFTFVVQVVRNCRTHLICIFKAIWGIYNAFGWKFGATHKQFRSLNKKKMTEYALDLLTYAMHRHIFEVK